MTIEELIGLMKREGPNLAKPVAVEGMPDMTFDCTFENEGASELIAHQSIPAYPPDLVEFWGISRTARLFEDKSYGQWGLEILNPDSALTATDSVRDRRFRDHVNGDVVIGRFLGDSDLLLIRCDPDCADFGCLLVATPLDPRHEWRKVADSFSKFLESFIQAGGDKYWAVS